jgi:hypothetical protein
MAIRPSDLQSTIIQSVVSSSLAQRAEQGPQQAAQAAQAQFAAALTEREESVEAAGEVEGNKVEARGNPDRGLPQGRKRRRPAHNGTFEEVVDEDSGTGEPPHLIDFRA